MPTRQISATGPIRSARSRLAAIRVALRSSVPVPVPVPVSAVRTMAVRATAASLRGSVVPDHC